MEQLDLQKEFSKLYVSNYLAKEIGVIIPIFSGEEPISIFDIKDLLDSLELQNDGFSLFKEDNLLVLNYSEDVDGIFIDIQNKKNKLVDALAQLLVDLYKTEKYYEIINP